MNRTAIKNTAARAITWSGIDAIARSNPFIVYYHRVVDRLDATNGVALPAMEITTAMLERHLDWLGEHYDFVNLDELTNASSSRPRAAVTFDDGYSDIYHHALPLLKRKGIPAGIFVVTGLVGSSRLPIHEELHALLVGASRERPLSDVLEDVLRSCGYERAPRAIDAFSATQLLLQHLSHRGAQRVVEALEARAEIEDRVRRALRPLSWEMLAEMRDAGMTIGSHTSSHPFLTHERNECVREEVRTSRAELQRRLGIPAAHFAYPGGGFNADVVQAVADAGYTHGYSICRHIDPQHPTLTIPRRGLWEKSCVDSDGRFSPAVMSCQTTPAFDWISQCTQFHGAFAQ